MNVHANIVSAVVNLVCVVILCSAGNYAAAWFALTTAYFAFVFWLSLMEKEPRP